MTGFNNGVHANQVMKAPALPGKRVLVVEDMPENLRLFRALLRLEGASILEAQRANEGVELATNHLPDLILMDLQMPGMDGITATHLLRHSPVTKNIPIVIVTASIMEEDKRDAFAAGCDAYLTKPIEPEKFGEQLISAITVRLAAVAGLPTSGAE